MPEEHGLTIEVATEVDTALHDAVTALIPQLSTTSPPPSLDELRRTVGDPATTLLVAKADGRVVGMLTVAIFRVPTGVRAWVEDVVVDDDARGSGALVKAALGHAEKQGARTVDLTSRPEREAANRLYVRLGFEQRETNVYRRTL